MAEKTANLWRLLKLFRPYWHWALLGVILASLTLLANIALMAVSGWFIAAMALAGAAGASMNYFSPAAIIRAAAIVRTGGRYAERLVTHEATFRLLSALRVWFYRRIEPLVPAALEDLRSGDLLSRIMADIDTLDNFYIRVIVPILAAAVIILGVTWLLSSYSGTLAVLVLVMLVLAAAILPWLMAWLGQGPGEKAVTESSRLRTQIVDGVQGLAELSVCGALEQQASEVSRASEYWIEAQRSMSRVAGFAQSGVMLLANITTWLVILVAIPLANSQIQPQTITPAELAMLVLLSMAAFEAAVPLPEAFRLLGQIQLAAQRLFSLADRKPVVAEPVTPGDKPERFDLSFQAVDFRYQNTGRWIFRKLNLDIPAGKRIAIVGETGIGKSSLISLLLHYRDVESGQVLLGDRPVGAYSAEQLHDWFAVVPQQVHLFNSTIRDNLLLAKPDAGEDELQHACRTAQLHDFIQQQPDGLDTWVGETGVKVSGGQARRIAIARALLRGFECLVLDEPGEGLDRQTERALVNALLNTLDGRSLILITHSQTGLDLMDEVIVLKQAQA